jgi:hypothetical protein
MPVGATRKIYSSSLNALKAKISVSMPMYFASSRRHFSCSASRVRRNPAQMGDFGSEPGANEAYHPRHEQTRSCI